MAELIIKDWQNGIADSRVGGFADMRNVDIYSEQGLLKPAFAGAKYSSTTVTDLVRWLSYQNGSSTAVYGFGNANKLYTASTPAGSWSHLSGNTTSAGSGNGMAVWKGYVFTARNTVLDIYNIGGASWSNSWGGLTLESDAYHPMIVGQDDILYIGNGRYVASIQENSGSTFDPGNAATYTATAQALDLPAGYRVRSLAEQGQNLMIGTMQGTNVYDKSVADVFPWNRIDSSFDFPIRLNERGVHQLLNVENTLWIVAGTEHSFYKSSNGTTAQFVRKIPKAMWNLDGGKYVEPEPGAICASNGMVLSGTGEGTGNAVTPMGIFSLTMDGRLNFEGQVSNGATGYVTIGALLAAGAGTFLASWQNSNSSAYGIDLFGNDGRVSTASDTAVRSQMYAVGTAKQKATFSELEIQLAKPLATGQSVVVGYRTDTSAAFTTLATFNFATYGAVQSFSGDIGLTNIENIQVEVQVSSNTTSTDGPHVYYVRLF